MLTGPYHAFFCHRVSDMVDRGYKLYGPPSLTNDHIRANSTTTWSILGVLMLDIFLTKQQDE
nr:DUF1737 domain-containing protein [Rosenbergiella epipactidis]